MAFSGVSLLIVGRQLSSCLCFCGRNVKNEKFSAKSFSGSFFAVPLQHLFQDFNQILSKMKAVFNFQIKLDDKQATVLFGMEECKGVDIDVFNELTKLLKETKLKIIKSLEKGGMNVKPAAEIPASADSHGGTKQTE